MSSLIGRTDRAIIASDVELIMFDKDGTLIDIHYYWTSMIRLRAQTIFKKLFSGSDRKNEIIDRLIDVMGVDIKSGRMKPEGPVGVKQRPFIVEVVTKEICAQGVDQSVAATEALFKEVDDETSKNLFSYLKILPGVLDFLKQAQEMRVAMAVVTTDITPRAKKAMAALKLDAFFREIVGGDQVQKHKPSPDIANLTMQRIGAHPQKCVVIGDHPVDINMGINCGVQSNIGVLTGLSDRNAFKDLNCKVVDTLEELKII